MWKSVKLFLDGLFHSRTIDLHLYIPFHQILSRVLEGEMVTNFILHQSESFTPIVQEHLPPIICVGRMVFHDPIKQGVIKWADVFNGSP